MKIDAYDDQSLIRLSQKGDKQAFGVLVRRYMRGAYFVALGLVGSHDDALDLSQDAFVRSYRAIRRFETGRNFFTWYYKILRNLCFNHLRDRKKRAERIRRIDTEASFQIQDAGGLQPDEILERKERSEQVWAAIEQLSDIEREVIVLREFQELSYQEIAASLDCPIGTVMSRLYNARRHLADKVKMMR